MLAFDRRAARVAWTVLLVALAAYTVYAVRRTLFVFILAIFFSYMLFPLVQRIERLGGQRMARTGATAIVFVALGIVVTVLVLLAGPPLVEQASKLAEQLPALLRDPQVIDRIPLPDWLVAYRPRVTAFIREHLQEGTSYALPLVRSLGQSALRVVGNLLYLILIPILAFLFIRQGSEMRDAFLHATAGRDHASMWRRIVDDLDFSFGRYIRALLILSAATIVVYSIFFSIAAVPFGLLLAAVAGALEFIPVIGPLAAAIVTVLVAGASGYDHLLLLAGFFAIYRLFQDYVLNPYLMSGGVEVPALLVLFGLVAGEELGGVIGIFLSVPVLAAARVAVVRIAQERRRTAALAAAAP